MAIRKRVTAKATASRTGPGATKKAPDPALKSSGKASSKPSAADQLKEYQRKRDFEKTAEPSGAISHDGALAQTTATRGLGFVIQKHNASHLHYDLRLEIDGVMKSWAIPKGPSADPSVKRLAMQVEDHPIDYNTFEGTIPAGQYGGGTVMLWDTGTYEIENSPDDDPNSASRRGHELGEMKIIFHGNRIKGSYALVRTKGMGARSAKPSWLLIKHRDGAARPESDSALTEKYVESVTTGRTMDEISKASRV